MRLLTALSTLVVSAGTFVMTPLHSQGLVDVPAPLNREWVGEQTAGQRSQAMVLHLETSAEGHETVDLPDFGALDIPAAHFRLSEGSIHFELVGDTSVEIFDASVDRQKIHGQWREGAHSGEFTLHPSASIARVLPTKSVSFNNADVRLSGTLLLPGTAARAPAAVFVQGAGPETRQASMFLAQYFVRHGVAALIYDKRGTGQSLGDWRHASFEELAGDAEAAVQFLRGQPEIDSHRIGLIGSSQGGWIAPMAALHLPDVAFVIVKSAAAVTPEQQELARVEIQMKTDGYSPEDAAEAQRLYRNAIRYARSGQGWDLLQKEIKADAQKPWALFEADTPKDYWFFDQIRLFFDHDPIPILRQLRAPLLVVFGGKDDDGPPLSDQIGPLLQAMQARGKAAQLAIFPNAGHDLRVVQESGEPWDFGKFAPGYLELLDSWLKLQTR